MKLSLKLPLAFTVSLLLLFAAALFGISRLNQALDTYQTTVAQSFEHERMAADMLNNFKVQVQEWKNVLLRGKDAAQRDRYWAAFQKQEKAVAQACPRRLYLPTADARLIAINADNGKVCEGFANQGVIDLTTGIGPFTAGGYYSTSPAAITRDLVIIGGHVTDNESTNEPSGVIRAYDVHDGHLVWNWDSNNPDDTKPLAAGKMYSRNSANMWSIASVDEDLGMIYLPLGNQTPDQWGADRTPGAEKYSAGVVALDLATGKARWNYQFTHHDLWDMDVGSQPTLVHLKTDDGVKPAIIVPTKQGSLYVLDRRDGTPIVPIREIPTPQGAVEGDHTSPTQARFAGNFNFGCRCAVHSYAKPKTCEFGIHRFCKSFQSLPNDLVIVPSPGVQTDIGVLQLPQFSQGFFGVCRRIGLVQRFYRHIRYSQ